MGSLIVGNCINRIGNLIIKCETIAFFMIIDNGNLEWDLKLLLRIAKNCFFGFLSCDQEVNRLKKGKKYSLVNNEVKIENY
ncbi:MAG: hypothetical protein ACRC1M_06040 [Methanobacteriaceae archaeon]